MDQISTTEEMAPHVRPGPHAGMGFREFVALTAALMAMVALAIDTMLPALPAMGSALGVATENSRQLIVTVFLLGLGVGQIFYGSVSDGIGRRPILLGASAAYVLFSVGAALSTSFEALLAFRALQGLSVAGTRVVTISMVRDCYNGRQMARVMSLAMIVFLAVPVLAPSIGQLILLAVSWRGLFAILAGYGAIVFTWLILRLPETLHPEYRKPVQFGSVLAALRLSLTQRLAVGYMLAQTVIMGALYGFINSVQQIFADDFHAPHLMPAVFAAIAGMMAAASLLNSRIVERLGTRKVSHAALIGFLAVEFVHLAIAGAGHETIVSFALCQAVAMFCFGLSMPNFGAMAMEPLASVAGTAASVQGFVTTVGGSLIGFAIGQSFNGTTIPVTAGFAIAGLSGLAIVFLTERGRLFVPRMARA